MHVASLYTGCTMWTAVSSVLFYSLSPDAYDATCYVETNPSPRGQSFRLGVFNAGGATKKAAGIHNIIHENKLDALALCETVSETTHDAVKGGLAPTGFKISHQHRTIVPGGPKKGGDLAFIVREDSDRHHKSNAVYSLSCYVRETTAKCSCRQLCVSYCEH